MDTLTLKERPIVIGEATNMLSFEISKAAKGNQTTGIPK
jgi:hypothetical protein